MASVYLDAIVDWCTHEDSRVFKREFICPGATWNALQYYQPLVCLDACHTKNKKYPCQLFVATILDGNMRGLTLCYGIACVENGDCNWTWFLHLLEKSIHNIHNLSIPFIFYRQKGLIEVVREVFPEKVHGHCGIHLKGNVRTNHGKAAEKCFWGVFYAHTKSH